MFSPSGLSPGNLDIINRMILLDGACGSLLWDAAERNGIAKSPTWMFNMEHPELVLDMHRKYIDAGCDMIQTNTFSANAPVVARFSNYSIDDIVKEAVGLAKQAAEGTGVKVYLSSGPLTQLLEPYGPLGTYECAKIYDEIIHTAAKSGVEAIMLETFMDIRMMKIAAEVAKRYALPVICSMTFEKRHRTMMGDTIRQICDALEPLEVDAVGMNCSKGPVEGLEVIKEYRETTSLPLYFKPNTGIGENYNPVQFADEISPALEYVTYIGGCCGTDETYIKELKSRIDAP